MALAPPRTARDTRPPDLGTALLPLRLFLGLTFVYAGIQKLSDPGFLHQGSTSYIGDQLHGFATGTPGGFILRTFAIPHPGLAGVGVAVGEIAIGLLVTFGLLTRAAALAGLLLNLIFFLTASWKTSPYFLGSDIVFVFAWLPFVLAGAAGQPALDEAIRRRPVQLARRTWLRLPPEAAERGWRPDPGVTRRTLLAEIGLGALAIAGVSSLLKGGYHGATASLPGSGASPAAAAPGGGPASTGAAGAGSGSPNPRLPAGAVKLAPSSRLPNGQAATYPDPGDGSSDILIRDSRGKLTAFSAICTHAGCEVGYDGTSIACPCHGATYDPATGEVTGGPAPQALAKRTVVEQGGEIYAVPS